MDGDHTPGRLHILPGLVIDDDDLSFTASRSSGPGGQNVNKVSSRVTLGLDLDACEALSAAQRQKIRQRLATRVTKAGVLQVSAQRERSQSRNRELARERLVELLREALTDDPERRPTRIPKGSRRRRLENKRRRSERKQSRSKRWSRDD